MTEVPKDRWDIEQYYDPDPEAIDKMRTRFGGFIEDIDQFDPLFFGISPREAVSMDPQQRLLLEVSWEALERAGVAHERLAISQTGVFVGITTNEYAQLLASSGAELDAYFNTGNALNAAAGRLSYTLGLQGPCMAIDTACSSSLVAVHLAVMSLRLGECDQALAGGVNLILSPGGSVALSQAGMLAPDGRCKTFDASADGYVRSEGCGMVVLKRLSDAQRNGDRILALIRGSAVNQDGPSSGLTVPNGPAQQALIRQALKNGNVSPEKVSYIEAHGTGTSLGDPIEVGALGAVFAERDKPLLIGSVKSNVGHLESAAGITGLIKVVLSLQNQQIPRHLHFQQPNPHINWDALPVQVTKERISWLNSRIAGVSSFGASGTNAHVILEAAPRTRSDDFSRSSGRPLHLLTLSAKTEDALHELAIQYQTHLARSTDSLANICFTANSGRVHHSHRLALIAASSDQMREKLSKFTAGEVSEITDVRKGHTKSIQEQAVSIAIQGPCNPNV